MTAKRLKSWLEVVVSLCTDIATAQQWLLITWLIHKSNLSRMNNMLSCGVVKIKTQSPSCKTIIKTTLRCWEQKWWKHEWPVVQSWQFISMSSRGRCVSGAIVPVTNHWKSRLILRRHFSTAIPKSSLSTLQLLAGPDTQPPLVSVLI